MAAIGLLALTAAACGPEPPAPPSAAADSASGADVAAAAARSTSTCTVGVHALALPEAVRETSGLAPGRARAGGLLWTHNDAGNDAVLHALDTSGALLGSVPVFGAEHEDWEDIEAGPCAAGPCLYIADTGDNDAEREVVTVYEVREPDPDDDISAYATAFDARYPGEDGARDAEALFMADGELYLISRGRHGPIVLYRFPRAAPGEHAVLERVRQLFAEPERRADHVTGATATPDGRWVAIRTYRALYVFASASLLGTGDAQPWVVDLEVLAQRQGESIAVTSDGTIWLTSEGEDGASAPTLSSLRCEFLDP